MCDGRRSAAGVCVKLDSTRPTVRNFDTRNSRPTLCTYAHVAACMLLSVLFRKPQRINIVIHVHSHWYTRFCWRVCSAHDLIRCRCRTSVRLRPSVRPPSPFRPPAPQMSLRCHQYTYIMLPDPAMFMFDTARCPHRTLIKIYAISRVMSFCPNMRSHTNTPESPHYPRSPSETRPACQRSTFCVRY